MCKSRICSVIVETLKVLLVVAVVAIAMQGLLNLPTPQFMFTYR